VVTRDAVDDGAANIERVHVLMYSATGLGGVARTVNTLAGQLARSHEVHLHSLFRGSDQPQYPIDPRVQVSWLIDNRQTGGRGGRPRRDPHARRKWRRWDNEPSDLEPAAPGVSAYTDFVLRSALPKLAPGLLITTRPMLHLAAARWAPASVLRIAQDHLNFEQRMRNRGITSILDEAVPTVDAFVTLTEADHVDYQKRYPGTLVRRIANPSPFHRQEQASPDAKVVVSAGRLVHRKGFDRLIDAWVPLAAAFPDWQLHIYGKGERRADLEAQIAALGVGDSVRLMGYTPDFDRVLADAGIYAMSSRIEGFPMVLLEAMSHGLPLVSFDCPRGPAEIIDDDVTGRLVKDDDLDGYTHALGEMMSDVGRRRRMGDASYAKAATYEIDIVAAQWEALFAEALDRVTTRMLS
jgi:glycosyltransferase involved in cell wall biosynthesis